jgi:bacillolysin
MNKRYSLTGLLVSVALSSFAQSSPLESQAEKVLAADGSPTLVTFRGRGKRYGFGEAAKAMREQLPLSQEDQMVRTKVETDALGFTHEKYQQYYRGVKVEHATYSVHAKEGVIESLSGNVRHGNQLNTSPKISASTALERALVFVGAKEYKWQIPQEEANLKKQQNNSAATYKPQGELVIVEDFKSQQSQKANLVLAWKFDIYAHEPISRSYIYIDAQTGKMVLQDAIMKDVAAPFATRYSGTRTIETDANPGGGFRLRDMVRGGGVITLNSQRTYSTASVIDFVDNDNNWTAAEYNNANLDNVAGDAQFGAEATFDYLRNVLGRNSWDNRGGQLRNYVHYGQNYSNASWDGAQMLFGDGNAQFRPWTSLDVVAHEIGHGVCQATANLVYNGESGALNEGFSDIWGACVEQNATAALGITKSTWLIAEEVVTSGTALRSMIDPKSLGQPAYYRGQNWYSGSDDNGGVHTNSGVLNHWFYILSQGETATNEAGNRYLVSGIGINTAASIAYRTESVYLTANSSYADARTFSIRAAQDLFGICAREVTAVTDAWYAVGVGPEFQKLYISSGPNQICAGTTATYTSSDGMGISWEATPASFFTNPTGSGTQFSTSVVAGARGTATIRISYCGGTDVKQVKVGPSEASGYYYGGGNSNTTLQTVQFVSPGQISMFLNEPFTFSFQSNPSSVFLSNSSGRSTSFYLGANQGVTIQVTSSQPGCGLASNFTFSASRGYSYSFAPNPSSDELIVTDNSQPESASSAASTNTTSENASFDAELYDNFGRKVKTQRSSHGKAVLDVRNLPNGLYNLRAGTGKDAMIEHVQITR